MTADLLNLSFALLAPMALGWAALTCLPGHKLFYRGEKLFLSFGLGFGMLTLMMFYFSVLKIDFSPLKIFLSCAVPLVAVLRLKAIRGEGVSPKGTSRTGEAYFPFDIFLVLLIVVSAAMVFLLNYIYFEDVWDHWAVWGFKAKIYFLHQRIPFERFAEFATVWGNWDYPHHVPLMEAWIMLNLGYWNDQLPRVIYPMFLIGLMLCVFYYCRRYIPRTMSLMAAFWVISLPGLQSRAVGAIPEPILLFYYIVSLALLFRWMETKDRTLFVLSAVFAGLMVWTKNEGIIYGLMNWLVLGIFLYKEKKGLHPARAFIIYPLIALAVTAPHLISKFVLGLSNIHINTANLSPSSLLHNFQHLPAAVYFLFFYFVFFAYFNVIWVAFLIVWIRSLMLKRPFYQGSYLFFLIALHMLLIIFLRLIDPNIFYLLDAMSRLLLAPAVLAVLHIFLLESRRDFSSV